MATRRRAGAGVDVLIAVWLVRAGSGHLKSFALVKEMRPSTRSVLLSGAITNGADVLAAERGGISPTSARASSRAGMLAMDRYNR